MVNAALFSRFKKRTKLHTKLPYIHGWGMGWYLQCFFGESYIYKVTWVVGRRFGISNIPNVSIESTRFCTFGYLLYPNPINLTVDQLISVKAKSWFNKVKFKKVTCYHYYFDVMHFSKFLDPGVKR